jgi:hypothetical protein
MRNFLHRRRILMLMRSHLSYANVMATIAVFIALGGTSYAVATLPRNSVGAKQIRNGAVGKSEIRSGAIRSKHLHDRSVSLRDISLKARTALSGQRGEPGAPGPPGPPSIPLSAAVSAGGAATSGTGGHVMTHSAGTGEYDVRFDRDLRGCYAVASLSRVAGTPPEFPDGGEIVTATTENGVIVRTRNSSGQPMDLPFHVIVTC